MWIEVVIQVAYETDAGTSMDSQVAYEVLIMMEMDGSKGDWRFYEARYHPEREMEGRWGIILEAQRVRQAGFRRKAMVLIAMEALAADNKLQNDALRMISGSALRKCFL